MRNSEIKRAKNLLQQALGSAQGNDRSVQDARLFIQKAIAKLEESGERSSQHKQQDTHAQKWWNNVVSGVVSSPHSGNAAMRSLEQLNKMSEKQLRIIDNIESEVRATQPTLLKD